MRCLRSAGHAIVLCDSRHGWMGSEGTQCLRDFSRIGQVHWVVFLTSASSAQRPKELRFECVIVASSQAVRAMVASESARFESQRYRVLGLATYLSPELGVHECMSKWSCFGIADSTELAVDRPFSSLPLPCSCSALVVACPCLWSLVACGLWLVFQPMEHQNNGN